MRDGFGEGAQAARQTRNAQGEGYPAWIATNDAWKVNLMTKMLQIQNLTKTFTQPGGSKPLTILDIPVFEMAEGEQAALIGQSGEERQRVAFDRWIVVAHNGNDPDRQHRTHPIERTRT